MKIRTGEKIKIDYPELALILYLFHDKITSGFSWIILGVSGNDVSAIGVTLVAVTFWFMLIALVKYYKRIKVDVFLVILFFVMAYTFSLSNPGTVYQIERQGLLEATFAECIPVYLLFRISNNYESMWRYAKKISWIIFSVYGLAFFVYDVGHVYRSYSAGMMLPVAVFVIEWLYDEKKKMVIPVIISVVFITIGGRRSSLIAVLLIVIVVLIIKKNYKMIICGIAAVAIIYFFWEPISNQLYIISVSVGVNSRVLRRMLSGNIIEDSHRFEQWAYVFRLIFSSPKYSILGMGIAGERNYMLNHFSHMVLQGYPHNVIVEIIGHYGIIIGVLMEVILFIVAPIKAFRNFKNNCKKTRILLLVITLTSMLLFQDSYLQSKYFFMYLAVLALAVFNEKGKIKWGR